MVGVPSACASAANVRPGHTLSEPQDFLTGRNLAEVDRCAGQRASHCDPPGPDGVPRGTSGNERGTLVQVSGSAVAAWSRAGGPPARLGKATATLSTATDRAGRYPCKRSAPLARRKRWPSGTTSGRAAPPPARAGPLGTHPAGTHQIQRHGLSRPRSVTDSPRTAPALHQLPSTLRLHRVPQCRSITAGRESAAQAESGRYVHDDL